MAAALPPVRGGGQTDNRPGAEVNARDTFDERNIEGTVVAGQRDAIRVRESLRVRGEEELKGIRVQGDTVHRPLVGVGDEHIAVRGYRQIIEQMTASRVRGDVSQNNVAGPQVALEEPGLA